MTSRKFYVPGSVLVFTCAVLLIASIREKWIPGEAVDPLSRQTDRQSGMHSLQEAPVTVKSEIPSKATNPVQVSTSPAALAVEQEKAASRSWWKSLMVEDLVDVSPLHDSEGHTGQAYIVRSSGYPENLRIEEWKNGKKDRDDVDEHIKVSVATQVLIRPFQPDSTEELQQILEHAGYVLAKDDYLYPWFRVIIPEADDADALPSAVSLLNEQSSLIATIEPDWVMQVEDLYPNEATFRNGELWGLHNIGRWKSERLDSDIDAPAAWSIIHDSPDVVVAVCDTGILSNHEDLRDNLWINHEEIPNDGLDNDNNGAVDDVNGYDALSNSGAITDIQGHGTHVAGIIGAVGNNGVGIAGISWNIRLMTCRWFGTGDFGSVSAAIKSINYARHNGADLINASWGSFVYSAALDEAVGNACEAGIIVIASSGNNGVDTDAAPHYPSSLQYSGLISVGASNANDEVAWFSNHGQASVDLMAPGESILSTYIGSGRDYRLMSGSSMSAPFVTGSLALLLSRFPDEEPELLLNRLINSADPLPGAALSSRSGGRLNIFKALTSSNPAPYNNYWRNAHVFSDRSSRWRGSNFGASSEYGASDSHPLWFRYNVLRDGVFRVSGKAQRGDTGWTLYRGSPKNANSRDNSWTGGILSEFFHARSGETLYLKVSSKGTPTRNIILDWIQLPQGDNLEDAVDVEENSFFFESSNRGATRQVGEPEHAGVSPGHSIWWKFNAPRDGNFVLSTKGSSFDTVLAVYGGNGEMQNLQPVVSNDDTSTLTTESSVNFQAKDGETFFIAVDAYDYGNHFPRPNGFVRLAGHYADELVILSEPEDASLHIGQQAHFTVDASTSNTVTFQWYHDGRLIPGATASSLVIPFVTEEDIGTYQVILTSPGTTLSSRVASLEIAESAPEITWQVTDLSALNGSSVTLAVKARGSSPLKYQWYKDNVRMPGQTSPELVIPSAMDTDVAFYRCVVSNHRGTSQSNEIPLIVVDKPWDEWRPRNSSIGSEHLRSGVISDDRFVLLSTKAVNTSLDGKSWRRISIPDILEGRKIAKINNRFVVAGRGESVAYSTDGIRWQSVPAPWTGGIRDMAFGGDRLIASGWNEGIFYSLDGINWHEVPNVTFSADQFVFGEGVWLTYDTGNKHLYHSFDSGQTWHMRPIPAKVREWRNDPLLGFARGSFWVWASSSNDMAVMESPDLNNWNTVYYNDRSLPSLNEATFLYHDNQFIIATGQQMLVSSTGNEWDNLDVFEDPYEYRRLEFITASENTILLGGNSGLMGISDSLDNLLIKNPPMPVADWYNADFVNGEFLLCTEESDYQGTLARSGNGTSWKTYSRDSGNPWFQNFAQIASNGVYYVGINHEKAFGGYDPLQLRPLSLPVEDGKAHDLSYGNNLWIVLGENGMAYSSDGLNWSFGTGLNRFQISDLTFAGERFFGISSNVLYSSVDGTDWHTSDISHLPYSPIVNIKYLNNKYIALLSDGSLIVSNDGLYWTLQQDTIPYAKAIETGGGYCFILSNRSIWFSNDLDNWFESPVPTSNTLFDFAWGADSMLAVGGAGTILQAGLSNGPSPSIEFDYPPANASVPIGASLEISVESFDPDGDIDRVEFYLKGTLLGTATEEPFSINYSPRGTFEAEAITAVAYSRSGNTAKDTILITPSLGAMQLLATDTGDMAQAHMTVFQSEFYAVSRGTILTSSDGIHWQSIASPLGNGSFTSITAGSDSLIATSDEGIALSRDGRLWIGIPKETTSISPTGITAGEKWIMGYDGNDSVAYSQDSLNWSSKRLSRHSLRKIVPGGGTMLAYYEHVNEKALFASTDGEEWTRVTLSQMEFIHDIIHAEGIFVMLVATRHPENPPSFQAWTSNDGYEWSKTNISPNCVGLAHAGGRFFAGSPMVSNRAGDRLELVSDDGITWHQVTSDLHPDIRDIAWNGNRFVAIGDENQLYTSTNGLIWEKSIQVGFPSVSLNQIASNGDIFTTLPIGAAHAYSVDGINWTMVEEEGFGYPLDIEYFKGEYYVCGTSGRIRATADWVTWRTIEDDSIIPYPMVGLATNGNTLVAVGQSGTFVSTTDGINWDKPPGIQLAQNEEITDVTFTGDRLMATSVDFVYHTIDGTQWSRSPRLGSEGPRHIAGKPGTYVGVSQNGMDLLISRDGNSWESIPRTWNNVVGVHDVSCGNDRFMVSTHTGSCLTSRNGTDWTVVEISRDEQIIDIAPYNSGYMALALGGSIYQSVDGSNWDPWGTQYFASSIAGIGNNVFIMGSGSIAAVSSKDLKVDTVQLLEGESRIGAVIRVSTRVSNPGSVAIDLSQQSFQWSASVDPLIGNTDDVLIGTTSGPASMLQPGVAIDLEFDLILPPGMPEGSSYLLVEADSLNKLWERNKLNNQAISVNPVLSLEAWSLDITANGDGNVLQSNYGSRYTDGLNVFLVPQSGKHQQFIGWNGADLAGLTEASTTLRKDTSITASFSQVHLLNLNTQGAGQVRVLPGGTSFPAGTTLSLRAIPNDGWHFSHWSGDLNSTSPTASIAIENDLRIRAVFLQSYEEWARHHFGSAGNTLAGRKNDPDGDSYSNEMERLLGSDPLAFDNRLFEMLDSDHQYTRLLYKLNTTVDQATEWQYSFDLENWYPARLTERILLESEGFQTREVTLVHWIKLYYRLVIKEE